MAYLHDDGELLVLNTAFDGRTLEVGLFNNSVDNLSESSTFEDITSTPGGGDYEPQIVSDPNVSQNADEDAELDLGELSYDISDATDDIDYVYVRDDTSGELIFTSALDQTYDLGSIDILDLTNVGMTLS
ncbi:hypothetical protein OB919_20065 [Halobacteria archaeon AArc-curdl1]|uniref:Uncharacterized protein n=1 Tax=Natronosalvus hydrolyticus TaxID=2979988 RepID=A0AAP2ZBL7_9EURY|nr:hypothetical protein [Halobacteria archaeon AArc-curdl1]